MNFQVSQFAEIRDIELYDKLFELSGTTASSTWLRREERWTYVYYYLLNVEDRIEDWKYQEDMSFIYPTLLEAKAQGIAWLFITSETSE